MLLIRKNKIQKTLLIIVAYLLIGITSFLIFNYYIQKERILTPLQANICITEVALSEGNLYFNNFKIEENPNYTFPNDVYTITMKKKDYIEYLDADPFPSSIYDNLIDNTTEPQKIYYDVNKKLINDDFNFYYSNSDNSKSLSIYLSKDNLPNYSPLSNNKEIINSQIESTKLKIDYYKDTNGIYNYIAQFKYNGIGYVIHSKNITQKEFIEILFEIIE